MTSPIGAIAFPTAPSFGVQDAAATQATTAAIGAGVPAGGATSFADTLTAAVDQLSAVQGNADALAAQAATGDLQDAHDYMIASTQAQLATDMVVSLRNKGVEAFNDIMRMQI